jgi:hypothetical protein
VRRLLALNEPQGLFLLHFTSFSLKIYVSSKRSVLVLLHWVLVDEKENTAVLTGSTTANC